MTLREKPLVRLEHANMTVGDIDASIRFLQAAFPEFKIRFDGYDSDGRRWVHDGTDDTYIALRASTEESAQRRAPYSGIPGVNHLHMRENIAGELCVYW